MTDVWIGIGSNVGERARFVRRAVLELDAAGVQTTGTSSLYETEPIGGPPQRSFVNVVVRGSTELDARALLGACKDIEHRLGRDENEMRWGPRVIDLDILMYGDEKISEPDLEIPHPRLRERNFVLIPLLEIDPDATDPWGSRLADLLDQAEGEVRLLEPF